MTELSLDGVYVRGADGALSFHELAEPSAEDVAEVARRTAMRLVKVLKRHGREVDPELSEMDVSAGESAEHSALSSRYAAAAAGTDLFGERVGSPALRLVDPSRVRPHEPVAIVYGATCTPPCGSTEMTALSSSVSADTSADPPSRRSG